MVCSATYHVVALCSHYFLAGCNDRVDGVSGVAGSRFKVRGEMRPGCMCQRSNERGVGLAAWEALLRDGVQGLAVMPGLAVKLQCLTGLMWA